MLRRRYTATIRAKTRYKKQDLKKTRWHDSFVQYLFRNQRLALSEELFPGMSSRAAIAQLYEIKREPLKGNIGVVTWSYICLGADGSN